MARTGRQPPTQPPDGRSSGGPLDAARDWFEREPEVELDRSPGWHLHAPTEPVDPWDCRRWPNSPFCQADPEIPPVLPQNSLIPGSPRIRDFVERKRPGAFELADFGFNNCEQWICVSPTIGGWSMPPICINHRFADCRDEVERPDPDTPPAQSPRPEPDKPVFIPNDTGEGWIRGCRYFVFIHDTDENFGVGGRVRQALGWGLPGYIVPCYGPILGLRLSRGFFNPTDTAFAIVCGGVGMLPRLSVPVEPGNVQSPSFTLAMASVSQGGFGTESWGDKFDRTREGRASPSRTSFHTPLLSGAMLREVWTRGPGVRYEFTDDKQGIRIGQFPGEVHAFTIGESRSRPSLHSIVRAADLPQSLGSPWGAPCAAPDIPPPTPSNPPGEDMGCSCRDIEKMIDAKLRRFYQILGFTSTMGEKLKLNPESIIKMLGGVAYNNFDELKDVEVENLPQLQAAIAAALFYRGGLHRLPAQVPRDITQDNNARDKIQDAMSWQEWLLKQLDALAGAYPLKIKHKDGDGNTKEITIQNQAEALAELIGIGLSLDADTDYLTALLLKGITEAIGARAAATNSADWGAAIAEYMGFRTKSENRNMEVSINPGANTLKGILEKSQQKQPRVVFDDETDLNEILTRILLGTEVARAAFYRKHSAGDKLPGETIRDEKDGGGQSDAEWSAFVSRVENPTAEQTQPDAPRPDIRNITDSGTSQT